MSDILENEYVFEKILVKYIREQSLDIIYVNTNLYMCHNLRIKWKPQIGFLNFSKYQAFFTAYCKAELYLLLRGDILKYYLFYLQ